MSNKPLGLTRNQLAEFLPNARTVRAFEQLLKSVGDLLPSDVATLNRLINESYIEASTASARADQALDALVRISRSLELISQAPSAQPVQIAGDVQAPYRAPNLSELPDVSIKLPVAGNLAIYDATLKLWKNATLTQGANITVTNADGSVTIAGNSLAVELHAVAGKSTPVDADELPLADSAASFALKKLTWANIKATLLTWLQTTVFPAPGAIGATTPGAGSFTSLNASTVYSGKGNTGSIANATPVTLFTATIGFHTVVARLPTGVGDVTNWMASATVYCDGTTSKIVATNTAVLLLTLSGNNVQVQQNSGGTQAAGVNYSFKTQKID